MLRRLFSILLFGATLLPLIAPMLSTGALAQSTLPACCRRNGAHHCTMSATALASMTSATTPGISAPPQQCPYRQHSLAASHLQVFTPSSAATHSTFLLRAPSASAQAECLRRISFDRSRQKRGPPSLLS